MIQNIDFNNDTLGEIGSKFVKNLNAASHKFRYMSDSDQIKLLEKMEKSIKNIIDYADIEETKYKPGFENLLNIIKELKGPSYYEQLRADMFDILIKNTDSVKSMPEKRFKIAISKYVDLSCMTIGEDKVLQFAKSLGKMPKDNMDPMLAEFVEKFTCKYPDMDLININAFKKAIVEFVQKDEITFLYGKIDSIFKSMSNAFPYTLKEVPEGLDNIIEFFQRQGSDVFGKMERPALAGAVDETAEAASGPIRGILKKLSDPKHYISTLKKDVTEMTEIEFQNKADSMGFSSMDKKTMLSVISNLEKIYDNIPKEELVGIRNALLKELKEHPDEFMRSLTSGTLATSLLTNGLVKSAAAVGISWTVLNIVLIWSIQTVLADMQLKAGRLGVMKAIESLDDPAYYANIIENKQNAKASTDSKSQEQSQAQLQQQPSAGNVTSASEVQGNLLSRFKK